MKFISTNGSSEAVPFLEAMKNGLAPDGGLYMPESNPKLKPSFWQSIDRRSFHEIAFEMAKPFLSDELSDSELKDVIEDAFSFPLRLAELNSGQFVLELST
ncbi:MAG: threonine synthase, partial [Bacteroidetes bacterium]|nr:threonine synthase [Bacteroidota bacterium]